MSFCKAVERESGGSGAGGMASDELIDFIDSKKCDFSAFFDSDVNSSLISET